MGTFKLISKNELRTRRKLNPAELALFDQYKSWISRIDGNTAAVYEFSRDEDRDACKALLRKAARAIDAPLRIIENETSLVFYRRATRKTPANAPDKPGDPK